MKKLILLLALASITSCNNNSKSGEDTSTVSQNKEIEKEVTPAVAFAREIEQAHNKADWEQKDAVSFDITLTMGGNEILDGTLTSLTNTNGIRLERKNNTSLIYDGDKVYISPENAGDARARFDMFTWQYFFSLPFKLTDPGTNWELLEPQVVKGEAFNRAKLSFDPKVGDSPDDWYIIYQEPNSKLLYAAAYIVTLGKEVDEAEKDPHAIVYHDYQLYDGIPVATRWTFHNWSEENGIEDQIGEAVIRNIEFKDVTETLFQKPEDSKEVTK